jgi:phage baseplate assembly protein gpV
MHSSHPIYRALVTYSSSTTGEIRVKIPALLGADSEVAISYIGRKSPWIVPTVGDQIVVTSDDTNLTNVFWLQTDQMAQAPTFVYKVGDTGPGGGVIFFVNRYNEYTGFTYLEVAPVSTHVTRTWATGANQTTAVSGADSRALGAGYQNTIDIVAQTGNVAATCAAVYCADLTSGGQSDWYLPSLSEMTMVYHVAHLDLGVAGFDGAGTYWTSSELAGPQGWVFGFQFGIPQGQNKSTVYRVCPIRRF